MQYRRFSLGCVLVFDDIYFVKYMYMFLFFNIHHLLQMQLYY